MKARILLVVNTAEFGGLERHLLNLAFRLDSAQAQCSILSYGPDFYSQRLADHQGIQVIATNQTDHDSFAGYLSRFRALRPAAIVFEKGNLNAFPPSAFLAAKLSGARNIVVIEQLLPEPLPPPVVLAKPWDYLRRLGGYRTRVKWMNRLTASFIDRTICVGTSIRDRLVQEYGFSAQRTLAVPNGVNLDAFRTASPGPGHVATPAATSAPGQQGMTVVCVSRLVPRKRIEDLLEAFARIAGRHPALRLLVVGTGPEGERLRARSRELGIDSAVHFEGYAEDVRPHLAKGTLFVTASENEGLPFSLLEAMASGLPCIATDIPGHRDVIVHGQNGLLVTLKSVAELAEAMEHLLTHAELRRQFGESGRESVERHFDAEKNMSRIAAEVLNGV